MSSRPPSRPSTPGINRSESQPLLSPRPPLTPRHSSSHPNLRSYSHLTNQSSIHDHASTKKENDRKRIASHLTIFLPLIFLTLLLSILTILALDLTSEEHCHFGKWCRRTDSDYSSRKWSVWNSQGPYTPFRSLGVGRERYENVTLPEGCRISQVNVLHRHGARYPTTSASLPILSALSKIQAGQKSRSQSTHLSSHKELDFLKDFDYTLKKWDWDELTNVGRRESWRSGRDLRDRYEVLGWGGSWNGSSDGIFVRAGSGGRVVETSGYFLQGFNNLPFKLIKKSKLPQPDVIIYEGKGYNNTLDPHTCQLDEETPRGTQSSHYLHSHLHSHILSHLNALLLPSPPLTPSDILPFLSLCGYGASAKPLSKSDILIGNETETTVAKKRKHEQKEGVCGILESLGQLGREIWEGYGYWYDLDKFYGLGEGSDLGPSSGVGYVNELIARLTDSEVVDSTTTNSTLDNSEDTFPRGGERIFADFSHDNAMVQIGAALGIIHQRVPLPITYPPPLPSDHSFRLSQIVPFGARWTFERITCDGYDYLSNTSPKELVPAATSTSTRSLKEDFIRIFVNDKLTPIDRHQCQRSEFVEHGLCRMDKFLESQEFARGGGDWDKCFV